MGSALRSAPSLMFTGIVTDIGTVRGVVPRGATSDMRLTLATRWPTGDIAIGASVACAGCCLTVVEKGGDWLAFDASGETLSRTTLGLWQAGTRVNLERSLRLGDELGGHIVAGHVDTVGRLAVRAPEGGVLRSSRRLGEAVSEGEVIGTVANPYDETETVVRCPRRGIIIGRTTLPVVNMGDALFHIAWSEELSTPRAPRESQREAAEPVMDEDEII